MRTGRRWKSGDPVFARTVLTKPVNFCQPSLIPGTKCQLFRAEMATFGEQRAGKTQLEDSKDAQRAAEEVLLTHPGGNPRAN